MKWNQLAFAFLGINLLLFAYSLVLRAPHVDDAWLGEHAYWQSKLGYVKSELMHGITQQEVRLLCHHKLLTLQGALSVNLCGFSLWALKSISLVYFSSFLLFFYFYCRKQLCFSPVELGLVLAFLVSNALVFELAFVFRPEMPLMALGFFSYFFVEKTLQNARRSLGWAAVGGLFAGLCMATHLNGIVFAAAGFLLLLWQRKLMQGLLFGLSTLSAAAIYFYDFTSEYGIRFWLYQLRESPFVERLDGMHFLSFFSKNVLDEHLRFFHSPKEFSFSFLLLVALVFSWKYLLAHKNLLRYTAILCVVLCVFAVNKTSKYLVPCLPFLTLIVVISLKHLQVSTADIRVFSKKITLNTARSITGVLIAVYLIVQTVYNALMATNKFDPAEYRVLANYVSKEPDSCNIVAPMTFVFNELGRFKSIQGDLCFEQRLKIAQPKSLLQLAAESEIDCILLNKFYRNKFGVDSLSAAEMRAHGFELSVKTPDFVLFKKTSWR